MRLIDIEAEVCADCVCRDKCDRQTDCFVKEMQTVDAVPVVRCRECKYHNKPPCPMRLSFNWTEDDDFCSYGEILTNTLTGETSVGWWRGGVEDRPGMGEDD